MGGRGEEDLAERHVICRFRLSLSGEEEEDLLGVRERSRMADTTLIFFCESYRLSLCRIFLLDLWLHWV